MGERSVSSISFSCFLDFVPRLKSIYSEWILPISICFIKKICEVTWRFIVMFIWAKTKPCMLTYSVKIFKELPTNKILSKHISSLNSKVEFCLNMGLVWRFLGWNSIILIVFFFCKFWIRWMMLRLWAQARQR